MVEGAEPPSVADAEALSAAELRDGWRLGCVLTVGRSAAIEVPASAAAAAKGFGTGVEADAGRIPVFGPFVQSGRRRMGLAVDIGTTALAGAIVDLEDGRVAASGSSANPQAEFGADVMSRIHASGSGGPGRERLTAAVRNALSTLAASLTAGAEASAEDIITATVVGNPTMLHLWRGADPSGLGVAPYLGLWTEAVHARAEDLGLPIRPAAPVYVLPCVRSHVGADAVSAAVAVGVDLSEEPVLMIDLGTNSELILGSAKAAYAASTAAGPAFECTGISCGMRATEGAIDALHLESDGRWSAHTIGNASARGICGSGLLDAVAELLRFGVIDAGGYLRGAGELAGRVPEALRSRVEEVGGRRGVVIVGRHAGGAPIALQAADVRQLQLAIGAVRAGIDVLCGEAGIDPGALARVFVAGSFGQFVRKSSMLRLGLLPPVPPERVQTVGNAAGLGAHLALLDRRVRDRAERLAARTRYVELAGRADYAETLTQSLRFPSEGGAT